MKPASAEQAVFAEALERVTPAARAAYLEEACGRDQVLRERVEALLRATEIAGDFLEQPPTGLTGSDPVNRDSRPDFASNRATASDDTNCSSKSAKAVVAWFTWPNRKNRCAAAWRSRSSNWAWTPSR
jgi:eukaryotic-like serine/threonine-protein kinase